MTVATGLAAPDGVRGGVHVRGRVLDKVATEVAATALQVPRDQVHVDVTEHKEGAALRVSAPLPIPDLDDLDAVRGREPVTEHLRRLQPQIGETCAHLLGRPITGVSFAITGAILPPRKRVR